MSEQQPTGLPLVADQHSFRVPVIEAGLPLPGTVPQSQEPEPVLVLGQEAEPLCEMTVAQRQSKGSPEWVLLTQQAARHLSVLGINVSSITTQIEEAREDYNAQPATEDRLFPWVKPDAITEHLLPGGRRTVLTSAIGVGREYELSPGQRDYMRNHYGMTPAQTVEVTTFELYADGKHIKSVRFRSAEHIDPQRRHVIRAFAIHNWGRFMTEAKKLDEDRKALANLKVIDGDDDGKPASVTKSSKVAKVSTLVEMMLEYGI